MDRVVSIFFLLTSLAGFGQSNIVSKQEILDLPKQKVYDVAEFAMDHIALDTISLSGKILFIDSLCDMSPQGHSYYQPYYLLLIQVTSYLGDLDIGHRIVVRTRSIKSLRLNRILRFKIERTEFEDRLIYNSVDSNFIALLDQVGRGVIVRDYYVGPKNCLCYVLKEKRYTMYELIE